MATTTIRMIQAGESLVGIEPELLQRTDVGFRRRMSLFTGRALTPTALSAEQTYRSGMLATLGQHVTYGVAEGLDLRLTGDGAVVVAGGYGFTALGEDVTLPRDLHTTLDALDVVDSITGVSSKGFAEFKTDAAVKGGVFVLLLQPAVGKATAIEIDTSSGPVQVSGDLEASCTRDPEAYAFEDWEIVDGARLVLAPWPDQAEALRLPAADPAGTFRNRLASMIYGAEIGMGIDGYLPFNGVGVALAVVSFDAEWKQSFVDRNAVVRSGGRARRVGLSHAAPDQAGDFSPVSFSVAEARLLELLEHTAQIADQKDLSAFVTLPPTGILPIAALDLAKRKNAWFPASWAVKVSPIHAEEVETALDAQLLAAPLDLGRPEEIAVLLPLTDEAYDPNVLVVEKLAQIFTDELNEATTERDRALQRRKFLQTRANVLLRVTADTTFNLDAGLTDAEKAARDATVYQPAADGSETFGTEVANGILVSSDVAALKALAATPQFTIKGIPLVPAADWKILDEQGLPSFIAQLTARIDRVDDAINIGFLQTQTDIYRYRTNVLNATDAARLVTSPIIANIAQRESATATAQDLKAYIDALPKKPVVPASPPGPAQPPPAVGTAVRNAESNVSVSTLRAAASRLPLETSTTAAVSLGRFVTGLPGTRVPTPQLDPSVINVRPTATIELPSVTAAIQAVDVTSQLPMAGIPFSLRTLSIAERLKTSPSHEALTYAIANRTTFLDTVIAADFGISVDDLEFLVAEQDPADPTKFKPVVHTLAELRNANTRGGIYTKLQAAGLAANADEPSAFSAGITSLDHHALLLRAVEARVASYRRFIRACESALASIQGQVSNISAALKQADNEQTRTRQNLAFVVAIINDENARIASVNAQRTETLGTIPFLVFMRPRTLSTESDVPSTQLEPADVGSAVPTALDSNAIVPPELREIIGLLREAPVAWMPEVAKLLSRIDKPRNFHDFASSIQMRAMAKLALPPVQSSATSHPGPYGVHISDVFFSQQQLLTTFVEARTRFSMEPTASLTWESQRQRLIQVAAINDLIAADVVHLEVAGKVAAIIQNASKVTTALYEHMSSVLPVNRLAWAEFLRGPGVHAVLRSLSILPGFQSEPYIEAQQMQQLVDWLFSQVDTSIAAAVSYLSDVIRTAILLASHAPVDDIIAGEIASRTKPNVGGIVPLATRSQRIGRGMSVLLYQGSELAARAVVDDLDASQAYAKVTEVYKADVTLERSSTVHFLNEAPEHGVMRKARTSK